MAAQDDRDAKLRRHAGLPPGRRLQVMEEEPPTESAVRDLWVPIGMLVVGLLWRGWQGTRGGATGVLAVELELLLATAAGLGGFVAATQFFDEDFGDVVRSLLKVAGIIAFALAIAAALRTIDNDPIGIRGRIIAIHGCGACLFFSFFALFRVDLLESLAAAFLTLVGVITAVVIIAANADGGPGAVLLMA